MTTVQKSMRHLEEMMSKVVDSVSPQAASSVPVTSATSSLLPYNGTFVPAETSISPLSQAPIHPAILQITPEPTGARSTNNEPYEEEDDFLIDAGTGAPMKSLLYQDEEARLRHERRSQSISAGPAPNEPLGTEVAYAQRPEIPIPTRRGQLLQSFPDPVDLGYCTESEGRHMFDL